MSFKLRTTCPACNSSAFIKVQRALIAPWVLDISNSKTKNVFTSFCRCTKCDSGFAENRYPDEVLTALYREYRGAIYFAIRNSWEPTYTQNLNSGLSNDAVWMRWRQQSVETFLESHGFDLNKKVICVDIGGGEGGVIPDFKNGNKYVLDANEKLNLEPNITRLRSFKDLSKIAPNLVMCCGLLEHLNDPFEFIGQLVESNTNERYLYFEVPKGIPSRRQALIASKPYMWVITRNRRIWRFISYLDRYFLQVGKGSILPIKFSEHLNFFSRAGLEALMDRSQLEVIGIGSFSTNNNLPDSKGVAFSDAWQVLVKVT